MKYKELFTPVKIGNVEIKNRFAMAPMGPLGLSDSEGGWNQRGIDYYVEYFKKEKTSFKAFCKLNNLEEKERVRKSALRMIFGFTSEKLLLWGKVKYPQNRQKG